MACSVPFPATTFHAMPSCPAGASAAECDQIWLFVILTVVVFVLLYKLDWWRARKWWKREKPH